MTERKQPERRTRTEVTPTVLQPALVEHERLVVLWKEQKLEKDAVIEHRNLIFKDCLDCHSTLVSKMKWHWTKKYYFLDPNDVESLLFESILVAIDNYKPSKKQSFKNFLWRICDWSMKSLIMYNMHKGMHMKVNLEDVEPFLKEKEDFRFEKKIVINQIYKNSNSLCKKILDGLYAGLTHTEIGETLVAETGRKLFPSEISYYIKTIRDTNSYLVA